MIGETVTDEAGRCFCKAHNRDVCHECCCDYRPMNEYAEIAAGLRPEKSRLEELAIDIEMLKAGIAHGRQNPQDQGAAGLLKFNQDMLAKSQAEWRELAPQSPAEAAAAVEKARRKQYQTEAEREGMMQGLAAANPGQTRIEFGGPQTQEVFEQVASLPPSAAKAGSDMAHADMRTCDYCKAGSATKLQKCSRCMSVAYCSKECQRSAWKAHKKTCTPVASGSDAKTKKKKLALTWDQVEAARGAPVEGKTLELRVMTDESMMRPVFGCKDRTGVVRRVAVYTTSRSLPGLRTGAVLRWKNPRFHYFSDGSSGARIEDEDVANISLEGGVSTV